MKRLVVIALSCYVSPLLAGGELELTAMTVSADNFMPGKYTDLADDGVVLNGGYRYANRSDVQEWAVKLENLGLDNRFLDLSFREARGLHVNASYREILYQGLEGTTSFRGNSVLTLPAGWQTASRTSGFSAATREFRNELKRKSLNLSLDHRVSTSLRIGVSAELTRKEGITTRGGAIYSNAANPVAALLPIPVDQDTRRLGVDLSWAAGGRHLSVSAGHLAFNNHEPLVSWQNPYSAGMGIDVDYPQGVGGLAGAPDYDQQSLGASGSFRIGNKIRVVLSGAAYDVEQQDDLPGYTINPALTATAPLPISSLDAALEVRRLDITVHGQVNRALSGKFRYRYKQRDNTANRYLWLPVPGDSKDQVPDRLAVYNRPLEKNTDFYELEGKYRLPGGEAIIAGYSYEDIYRNYAAVTNAEEETWRLALQSGNSPMRHRITSSLVNHSGSTYQWANSFLQLASIELINNTPDDQRWSNHPLLRQYHLANHETVALGWQTDWTLNGKWNLQFSLDGKQVDFDKSELGLTEIETRSGSLTASYTATDQLSAWAWLEADQEKRYQTGRDFTGGIQKPANQIYPPLAQGSDPARNYDTRQKNRTLAFGIGYNWEIRDNLTISQSWVSFDAREDYAISTSGARDLQGGSPGEIRYRLHDLNTTLKYLWRPAVTLSLTHRYLRYQDDDFQREAAISNVLLAGFRNPDDVINVIGLSIKYDLER